MIRELITLPLRLGARTVHAGLRAAEAAAAIGLAAAGRLGEAVLPGRNHAAVRGRASRRVRVAVVVAEPSSVSAAPVARPDGESPAEARSTTPAEPAEASADAQPTAPPEPSEVPVGVPAATPVAAASEAPETNTRLETTPAHVSEEPQLVEAFAEPGAEDGAEVQVREPWEGYARLTAKEVMGRLADASPEALAAVELYERAHRNRRTVLSGADRQLRRTTASAA